MIRSPMLLLSCVLVAPVQAQARLGLVPTRVGFDATTPEVAATFVADGVSVRSRRDALAQGRAHSDLRTRRLHRGLRPPARRHRAELRLRSTPRRPTDSMGNAALPLPLPSAPALKGAVFAAQWVVAGGSACAQGLELARGIRVQFQ